MRLTYTADYDLTTLHGRLLPVLKCIDQVCRQHNLTYYLWAGTMLGAVRHKGFIPWDDDVDIAMPRPDYERLMQHCHEWVPMPFEIIGPHNRPDYPYPFAKVEDSGTTLLERPDFLFPEGIYVDIFPIDGIPAGRIRQWLHIKHYKLFRHLLFLRGRDPYKHGHGLRSLPAVALHKAISLKWIQHKVKSIMSHHPYDGSTYVIDHDFNERGIMPKHLLGQSREYQFEGLTLNGVEHYDAYLTLLYGDYMTPPPAAGRVQHNFLYLNLDKPYREHPLYHKS